MAEEINPLQLKKRLEDGEDIRLLDVREPYEYEEGHIENSVLIPVGELTERMEEIDEWKDETIVAYCRTGQRSAMAQQLLQSNGFEEVFNLDGGIEAWEEESG